MRPLRTFRALNFKHPHCRFFDLDGKNHEPYCFAPDGEYIMNKAELVDRVSQRTQMTKQQSETLLDAAIEVIQSAVSKGEDVKLVGFGTFSRMERKARVGRNPKTGVPVSIPGALVPRFKPGKEFKESVR
jgi:DNA-binding protein HU-beta